MEESDPVTNASVPVDPVETNSAESSCLEDGKFHCVTTKCVESLFAEKVTNANFAEKCKAARNCLARPEQDLILFSRVCEERVSYPSELAEPHSQPRRGDAGGMVSSLLPKLFLTPVSQIVHPCLAVPHDMGMDVIVNEMKSKDQLHFFYEEWLFLRPQTQHADCFRSAMKERIRDGNRTIADERATQRQIAERHAEILAHQQEKP